MAFILFVITAHDEYYFNLVIYELMKTKFTKDS